MAKNQPSYLNASSTQISELGDLAARGNGFFHISAREVPSIIPGNLRAKWDSAVVVVSGSTEPNGAVAIIGHRIDQKARMMDHDPFLMPVAASVPQGNGVLIHHAAFDRRSLPLPDDLSFSTSEGYFRRNPPFGLSSGSTGQLPTSLYQAFDIAQRALSSTRATT